MKTPSKRPLLMLAAASLLICNFAWAEGRTDGPEGSEIGHGGYDKPTSGRFSLSANFGGAFGLRGLGAGGAPIYVGLNTGFWVTDWFVGEFTPNYNFQSSQLNMLVGARFRTPTWPVSVSAGLRTGVLIPVAGILQPVGVRFGISPVVGVEAILIRKLILGLEAVADIPLPTDWPPSMRIGLNVGWKF